MDWISLLYDGTFAILFITVSSFGTTFYLVIAKQSVPEWLTTLDASLLTFWSGMGVGQWRAKVRQDKLAHQECCEKCGEC